jgi:hypothetical protein
MNDMDDNFSVATMNTIKYKKTLKMMKMMKDDGYEESTIYDSVNEKYKKISYYNSGYNPSCFIRDAVTGRRTNIKIGSCGEYLFFKVKIALEKKDNPISLFFSSPDEYERHFLCKVDINLKKMWLQRRKMYEKILNEQNRLSEKNTIVK